MKNYFRHFLWLYIILAVLLVPFLIFFVKGKKEETEIAGYTRTNTGCLTDERVFDYADKLTAMEEDMLRELIAQTEDEIGCDIVLLTIDEQVSSMMDYADDFYDYNGFGYNKECGDGAIYVDNWATGDVWFSTCGRVEDRYSTAMIDRLIDDVCEDVNDDPYYAYRTYVNRLGEDMSGRGGSFSDAPSAGYAFLIALIVTAFYLIINLIQSKGKRTTTAITYVPGGRPFIRRREDIFLNKHVTKRHIDTSGGSGGGGGHHISHSGVSHGGGGGHH